MLLLILALQTQTPGDAVMAAARRAVSTLGDTAAVRAAHYAPIREMGVPDGLPFQGVHWSIRADTVPEIPLDRPQFVMFALVNGVLQRVGVAYAARVRLERPVPPRLGNDSSTPWHEHFWCTGVPGTPPGGFVVNIAAQCVARGGTLDPFRLAMVHVWTDVPNPHGQYGHDNPALPFVAVGLTPPSVHELHDPAAARFVRSLGMALAETYGSRLPVANRVQRENTDAALADSVGRRRAAIATRIPLLKAAESGGDRTAYDRIGQEVVSEWQALLALYGRMAATEQLRTQVARANDRAVTVSAHD